MRFGAERGNFWPSCIKMVETHLCELMQRNDGQCWKQLIKIVNCKFAHTPNHVNDQNKQIGFTYSLSICVYYY